jgi:adenine-specific DNA-methyltransferase
MANLKNKFGQYMTPKEIAIFMLSLSTVDLKSRILEPCCGDGVFLDLFDENGYVNYVAYEIDEKIIKHTNNVLNRSFVSASIDEKFDLIIGNPPYIRWKNLEQDLKDELGKSVLWEKYCNALCDYSNLFIIKSIELLKEGGELIFITPEYWLKTTHSIKMRNYMMQNGFFEAIYHFNETPIFEKATVSTMVFKYRKSKKTAPKNIKVAKYYSNKKLTESILHRLKSWEHQENTEYILIPQFEMNKNWILAPQETIDELNLFENQCKEIDKSNLFPSRELSTIGDVCDIGNGMVSGLDKAFQVENVTPLTETEMHYSIHVMKAKNLSPYFHGDSTRYIFINEPISENEFKGKCPNYYQHLLPYVEQLDKRYHYNRDIKYWEWVFLRNYNLFNQKNPKIFVPCKERISHKNYFRFSYMEEGIFPTQDVTALYKKEDVQESLLYILALLNSRYVFDWLRFNGVVKGSIVEFSEKPIASIPFRRINFNDENEANIHDKIVSLTKNYLTTKKECVLNELNKTIDNLFMMNGENDVCEL